MVQKIADQRDIDFVLYEQLQVEELLKSKKYAGFNKKMFDMVIKEVKNLSVKEIYPTYTECDKVGVTFGNNKVTVPECLRKPHRLLFEGEWGALSEDPEYGGQGLPYIIAQAAMEYITAANGIMVGYLWLGHGAGKMIDLFGTREQKDLFLEKLYAGVWSGTMMLTEPEAGSDVGALSTSAKKLHDGTYEITGNKIFISNGEQNLTRNIIHLVLARIEGAPGGTLGISLFIVPKIWVNPDGSLGEPNDVVCTGVEEKMGLHGSPTCSMSLGSRGKCRGILLGEANKGMKIMFHMMNEVRLEVGTQGFASGSVAYLHALDYARQRLQGRPVEKLAEMTAQQVPIIQHPDVRRMLLRMKSYVEGLRSLIYFTSFCIDKKETALSDEDKRHHTNLIEILTPVVKAYSTERGFDVCVEAMQVFGGYGYMREYPIEQLLRDSKIASIYEGTNGIQAMDFLGRKILGGNGRMLDCLVKEINACIQVAKDRKGINSLALKVQKAVDKLEQTCRETSAAVMSTQMKSAFACAHPLLDATGDVIMAWMHLWRASIALNNLDSKDARFYQGKITTAQFFINTILPVTMGKLEAITYEDNPAVIMDENAF